MGGPINISSYILPMLLLLLTKSNQGSEEGSGELFRDVRMVETVTANAVTDTTELIIDESLEMNENVRNQSTNSSQLTITTTPSTTITPTTTTSTSTTTTTVTREESSFTTNLCTCDLIMNSCDVNCCCDKECSRNDTKAFSTCTDQNPVKTNPRYCYRNEFLYTNNTQFIIEKTSSNLFCIVTDNNEERSMYKERQATQNSTVFRSLESRHRTFQWAYSTHNNFYESENHPKPYKAGDPIWMKFRDSDNFGYFHLPSKVNSGLCHTNRPVIYMQDYNVECDINIDGGNCTNEELLDANLYFNSFDLISSPTYFDELSNASLDTSLEMNAYITIKPYMCLDKECDRTKEIKTAEKPTNKCENLVKSVNYHIYHDGSNGIDNVDVFIHLINKQSNQKVVRQILSYSHFWAGENITDVRPKSGNPGYIVGKPVIAGSLISDADQEFIQINSTILSIFQPGPAGLCDLDFRQESRTELEFGYNIKVGCSLNLNKTALSESCSLVKNKTFQMLTGEKFKDIIFNKKYIATFGNSDPNKPGDWVPSLYSNLPNYASDSKPVSGRCPNLVRTLHIEIVFANIGSVSNPQSKIIGTMLKFGNPIDELFNCVGLACNHRSKTQRIDFSTSVSFVDVTAPAAPQFAEYPVLEAKFPYDFFYPFVGTSSSLEISKFLLMFYIVFLITVGH